MVRTIKTFVVSRSVWGSVVILYSMQKMAERERFPRLSKIILWKAGSRFPSKILLEKAGEPTPLFNNGEAGIRTQGPPNGGQRFSRPPDSTTLAPLQKICFIILTTHLGVKMFPVSQSYTPVPNGRLMKKQ